ncbi:MAG: NAD(P)-binding domain-containing protein [Nitrosomonas sp.]|nr:NAD(P)-binding domain-containing protein [Nitrosomonas sp.]
MSCPKIGFIGLGIMGKPMASRLIESGYVVFLHSRSGVPDELITAGGHACRSAMEVSEKTDIVILMLPDTPDVENVLFSENGVAVGLTATQVHDSPIRKIIVDMSSISPGKTCSFAACIAELGHDYADAPVSGGQTGAQQGTLTIMVGAISAVFEKIRPVLARMGQQVTHIGAPGTGQICKMANQIVVAGTLAAVAEALVFSSKAGADVENVRRALLGGFAASRILDVHGERMINHDFQPGFRVDLQVKDLNIALACAAELGISLPNTALTQSLYQSCVAQGDQSLDSSVIVRVLEKISNHEVSRK